MSDEETHANCRLSSSHSLVLCSYSANENRQKQGLPIVGTSREVGLKLKGIGRPCSSTNHSADKRAERPKHFWVEEGRDRRYTTPSTAVPKQDYGTHNTILTTQTQQLMRRPPICTASENSYPNHPSKAMRPFSISGTFNFSGTHIQLQPRLMSGTIFSKTSLSFSICLNGLAALAVELFSNTFAISHHSIHSVRGMMKLLAQIVHLLPPDSFFSAALTRSS